jgi:hypothetical protein
MPNPLLELIESGDRNSVSESSYFQAEVTSIDSTTGRIYILRLDDEDGFPDDEPYPVLQGAIPQIGDWVMMARWGRTAVCLGKLVRTTPSSRFDLSDDAILLWGSGDPNSVVSAPPSSIYFRTDSSAHPSELLYVKASGTGNIGWVVIGQINRRRVTRQIAVYAGASLVTSFVRTGFPDDPNITATSTANGDATSGMFLAHSTAATINTATFVSAGANSGVRPEWEPYVSFGIRTPPTITLIRCWYGLFSASPTTLSDPVSHGAGFRFDTSAGDTNFMAWSNDGSGGGTITDTGWQFTTSAGRELAIKLDGVKAIFYIDGEEVARHTTNLPISTGLLDYGMYVTTLSAAARTLRWGRITMESEP